MDLQNVIIKVPLLKKEDGTFFVARTRVPLDTIIYLYKDGATPEEVVDRFSVLNLADIYLILAYYLQHQSEVDCYLAEREVDRMAVRRDMEMRSQVAGMRERLLARQKQDI